MTKVVCEHCHKQVPEAKFCFECGKPLPKKEPEIKSYPPIMTISQTAEFLSVSKSTLYRMIREDGLPWFGIGSHKRIIFDELMAWSKSKQQVLKGA